MESSPNNIHHTIHKREHPGIYPSRRPLYPVVTPLLGLHLYLSTAHETLPWVLNTAYY
jgi:hypothetical protein